MRSLEELRKEIDRIDKELVALFEERMDISKEVAQYKLSKGINILDTSREEAVIKSKKALLRNKEYEYDVEDLYASLMALSRKQQFSVLKNNQKAEGEITQKNTGDVVFQGVPGSYGDEASFAYFGENAQRTNVTTMEDVFISVKEGKADFGVLPIENSSTGLISQVYNLLLDYDCSIIGEQQIKVNHCLLGLPDASLSDIKEVYSHEQGLSQSSLFLNQYPNWNLKPYLNTASSAKFVMESGDIHKAAIASERAGEIYGLKVLSRNINNSHNNYTRFAIISQKMQMDESCNKVSVAFTLPHRSGSLYEVLSIFADRGLNMVRIESRPLENKKWEYMFFVDFTGNLMDETMEETLNQISSATKYFKMLGNYKGDL